MSIFVIGGTGFIGSRLVRVLAERGERVVCMDLNPRAVSFEDLGERVKVVAGDITQFDDVMAKMAEARAGTSCQSLLHARQLPRSAQCDEAQRAGNGQLLRSGPHMRRETGRLCELISGVRFAAPLR